MLFKLLRCGRDLWAHNWNFFFDKKEYKIACHLCGKLVTIKARPPRITDRGHPAGFAKCECGYEVMASHHVSLKTGFGRADMPAPHPGWCKTCGMPVERTHYRQTHFCRCKNGNPTKHNAKKV